MKRDMDLIRKILFDVEKAPGSLCSTNFLTEKHSPEEIAYHFELLIDAGFAKGEITKTNVKTTCLINSLTWQGQEFLDLCKKDTIWEKAKKESMKVAGSLGFDIF